MAVQGIMKMFLLVLNIIFFIIGAATLCIAVWVKVDNQHLLDLTKDVSGTSLDDTDVPSLLENAVVVLIVVGAFIFFLGFLGCCGTMQNKSSIGKLFLKIYSTVVLILLILEAAGVSVAWLFFDKVEVKLGEYLDSSIRNRYNASFTSSGCACEGTVIYSSGGDPITLAWDIVQLQFRCCGRLNGTDYVSDDLYWDPYRSIDRYGTEVNMTVPPTCCEIEGGYKPLVADMKKLSTAEFTLTDPQCPFLPANTSIGGCYEKVTEAIISNSVLFIAIGCTTVGVEIMCVLFSCCLGKRDTDEVDILKPDKE